MSFLPQRLKPKPVTKNLTDMKIGEISLVDDGANADARIVIVKRAQTDADTHNPEAEERDMSAEYEFENDDELDMIEGEDGGEEIGDDDIALIIAGPESGEPIIFLHDDLADLEDAENLIEGMIAAAVEAGDEGAVEAFGKMAKMAAVTGLALSSASETANAVYEAGEEIAKRDATIADYEGQIRKMGLEPVAKTARAIDTASLPEEIRKQLEEGSIALEAVAKMMAKEEEREWVSKAANFGIGQPEVTGLLLMRVAKRLTTEDDAEVLAEILKNAGNVAKNAELLATLGDRGGDVGIDGQIAAAVAQIRKRVDGADLTEAQAFSKALNENPALYEQYRAARR